MGVTAAVTPFALTARPVTLCDECLRHRLETRPGAEEFEALRFLAGTLRGQHGDDRDAVDVEIGVGPQDVAGLGPARQQRTVEEAPGLTCPGGAPRPRAVGARARQLDFDPAGHV